MKHMRCATGRPIAAYTTTLTQLPTAACPHKHADSAFTPLLDDAQLASGSQGFTTSNVQEYWLVARERSEATSPHNAQRVMAYLPHTHNQLKLGGTRC